MGNLDDDGASFEQRSYSNGNAKPAAEEATTPISNGHIPNSREEQRQQQQHVENVVKAESEEQLLLKRIKFSAPAYTEIRTPTGGLNLKVSIEAAKNYGQVW